MIQELKIKIEACEANIKNLNEDRKMMKDIVKDDERTLKATKRRLNRTTKAWVSERKRLKSLKAKLSALPSQKRRYAKEHMGVVLDKFIG